ncbi:DUF1932 domain-containing protein [Streptomyces shenzhenensis]|uniref:DUF1932 domain-containing protein n=1 Tax=Streptomyces shenzhenensis TaxID=943815 RepID=UPI003803E2C8
MLNPPGEATRPPLHIGFVGYGEAGSAIANGLAREPGTVVHVYDPTFTGRTTAAGRTAPDSLVVATSVGALTAACTIVLSTVVAAAAVAVAEDLAPHIGPGHLVADLNSVSPATKERISTIVSASGAAFVEAAIMTNISANGHGTPIYACGERAGEFAALAGERGMNVDNLGPDLGQASATKMFRSIIAKGLEALLLESLTAAARYDVADRVLAKVEEGYPGLGWSALADHLLGRTAVHGRRRADEMFEVAATLEELGMSPFMAAGAAHRIRESGTALEGAFTTTPSRYQDVVAILAAPLPHSATEGQTR